VARSDEVETIRRANRASMVGRLMLGQLDTWEEFLRVDLEDLESLPRRNIKAGASDVRKRVSKELKAFCSRNFVRMDEAKLSDLYEEIKAHRGLEMPLPDFEAKFATVKDAVLKGQPGHSTVVISLWGLQFQFPESMLAKDVSESLDLIREADATLSSHNQQSHSWMKSNQSEISRALRRRDSASRMCLLSCFNLVEAFLNGLAWDFSRRPEFESMALSNRSRKLLQDGSIGDKLRKYPEIISGSPLWGDSDDLISGFIDYVKPFRDSLVHASPFSDPNRYGGLDKLEHLYRIDAGKAKEAAEISVEILEKGFRHIKGSRAPLPDWLKELSEALNADVN